MKEKNIAIIGAGNMGSSLLAGLIANGYSKECIAISDPSEQKCEALQKAFLIHANVSNRDVIKNADIIILAVKPQIIETVMKEIASTVRQQKPLIISIAAGISIKKIQAILSENSAIIRVMPNMPVSVNYGASALFANSIVSDAQRKSAEWIFNSVGVMVWLQQEKEMDIVTALSGSGPAYFFLIMEALQNAAEKLGLPSETARILTLQTALGAAHLARENKNTVAILRKQVTSKGGTTERALDVLEQNHIREIIEQAVNAAATRSIELGK